MQNLLKGYRQFRITGDPAQAPSVAGNASARRGRRKQEAPVTTADWGFLCALAARWNMVGTCGWSKLQRFNDLTMIARMVSIHAQLPPEYAVEKGEMILNSSS
jgi:hypothetical protein